MGEIVERAGWTEAYEARTRARLAAEERVWPERIGRVSSVHRGGYTILTNAGDELAQAPASLRRTLEDRGEDRPVVGDWVGYESLPGGGLVLRDVLPRQTTLVRKKPHPTREIAQVLVANVDRVLIVTSIGRDFNVRRLERYVSLVKSGNAEPVIVISKIDLEHDREALAVSLTTALPDVGVQFVSSATGEGIAEIESLAPADATVAMLGSSGVGKSTLANVLRRVDDAAVGGLSVGGLREDGKGRHTTTRRELVRLPSGAVLIDTPGMRELGLWEADEGVTAAFADVADIAAQCRFSDCRHEREPGCAIREAISAGALSAERYASYAKLLSEDSVRLSVTEQKRIGRIGSKALRARLKEKTRK